MTILIKLANLKSIRSKFELRRPQLALLSGISLDRLRLLEQRADTDPWFHEAAALARCLNLSGILPLISSQTLSTDALRALAGPSEPKDLAVWRSGHNLPLYLALRIALDYGFDDPYNLVSTPLQRQLWDTIEHNERAPEAGGRCPWCRAIGLDHERWCVPALVWSPRPIPVGNAPVAIRAPGTEMRGRMAHGLRALRERCDYTQAQMATIIGVHPNYYSRIETLHRKLLYAKAQMLAGALGVPVHEIYETAWESATAPE